MMMKETLMQDTGEVQPGAIAEEMTDEEWIEVVKKFYQGYMDKTVGAFKTPYPSPEPTVYSMPDDHAILLEQITLLRDLLAGKDNWLDAVVKEERARNERLLAENAVLRKEAERLRIALAEVLTIDYASEVHNINDEDFERLWDLTRVQS
jgi:hypothetical protein